MKQHHATRLRFSTTAIVAVVSALFSLFLVIPAAAHAGLKSSDPADGATLTAWPASVTFTFLESIQKVAAEVTVTGPDGQVTPAAAPPTVEGAELRAALSPMSAPGAYTLSYRVTALDGDASRGKITFTFAPPAVVESPTPTPSAPAPVTTPSPATTPSSTPPVSATETVAATTTAVSASPTSDPATADPSTPVAATTAATAAAAATDNGIPAWIWIVLVVLIIAVAAVVLLRQRRNQPPAA